MIVESTICPYTGLRPFAEEESIYFKGRDEHIDQATKQLQINKFIMLTGASGDGKSSLVYAGILPNARAGFLKSQFSNWAVAHFRPERNPLENLSHALATQLGIANDSTVVTELNYGFSALTDMYKASKLYIDVNDAEWSSLDEKQRATRKRGASNLIIVADQFEEFFTNPENFQKGVPSQEASLVTNILLETARIALEENLPVYVIITMRSDFIGQCAAFRGLPEAIGFSQFFVPRLNRAQLQEVIEEPAALSGNTISKRLTERLIHDMVEGTDQLPILQHALNQIWKMADEGREEMDLIHYAMVGGMPGTDLLDVDAQRFHNWFDTLPEKLQVCYDQPDLQNVLNTHADKLCAFASEFVKEKYADSIMESETQYIIETAFKCLTKIDNSRAVRNRMTLAEITAIVDKPGVDHKKVGKILNIFREPGNTLLRPFHEELPELPEDAVLDITHESLIRNWDKLSQWAIEEYNNYTTFLDFNKQLNRWVDSGKSNSFLLYMGPLTFFENFFVKIKPNVAWIARYLGEGTSEHSQKEKAKEILVNAHEFLRLSANKHVITRTVLKVGPGRIAALFGMVALIALSAYSIKTYLNRQNGSMLDNIRDQSVELISNAKVPVINRSILIGMELRLKMITIPEIIAEVHDPAEKIKVANTIAGILVAQGRIHPRWEIAQAIDVTDSLFSNYTIDYKNNKLVSLWLRMTGNWRATLGLAYYYNETPHLLELQKRNARRAADCILQIIEKQYPDFKNFVGFSNALETAINFDVLTPQEREKIIATLSPFGKTSQDEWVSKYFSADQVLVRGYQGYGFNHNGLYQELACLYAAAGKTDLSLQAIDTLLKYNGGYFQGAYENMLDNASNIASVLYRSGHANMVDDFVTRYCNRRKIEEVQFYHKLVGRMLPYQLTRNMRVFDFWDEDQNLNLQYGERKEIAFFFEKQRASLNRLISVDERNFFLAISWKNEGLMMAHREESSGKSYHTAEINEAFRKSVSYYQMVDEAYLSPPIERLGIGAIDVVTSPRRSLYLFPDMLPLYVPHGARDYHWNYLSASFMEYLIDMNLFEDYYRGPEELLLIEDWLGSYEFHVFGKEIFIRNHADPKLFIKLESSLMKMSASSKIDLNLLYLFMGRYAVEKNDQQSAVKWYSQLKPENFNSLFRNTLLGDFLTSQSLKLVAWSFTCLMENGKAEQAQSMVSFFKNPVNRSSIYAFAAREFKEKQLSDALIQPMLDSSAAELKRIDKSNPYQPNRSLLAVSQVLHEPTIHSAKMAKVIIKNQPLKYDALQRVAQALSYQGEIFMATRMIPANISDSDHLFFLFKILKGYADSQPRVAEWEDYENNVGFVDETSRIPFANESK